MLLSEPKRTRNSDRQRISVDVTWEDSHREGFELFFEVDHKHAEYLPSYADPFLVASIAPAYRYGESRIKVAGETCPILRANLNDVVNYLRAWHHPDSPVLRIECDSLNDRVHDKTRSEHAAQMFSGGIDSYATLALNRRFFAPSHPKSIRTGVISFGLEQDDPDAYSHVLQALTPGAQALGIDLVSISSNVYLPYREEDRDENWLFWIMEFMGTGLSSQLHALSNVLTSGHISATDDPCDATFRAGSTAKVDDRTSSSSIDIRHSAGCLTRQQKIDIVATNDAMLSHLRVCNQYRRYSDSFINCGRCEKCIRTKLQLIVASALERCNVFEAHEVTAEHITGLPRISSVAWSTYERLTDSLAAAGRDDLATAVKRRLRYDKVPTRALGPKLRKVKRIARRLGTRFRPGL